MDNFLVQRVGWRMKASKDLEAASSSAAALLDGSRVLCALYATSISGGNWAGLTNAEYLVGLTSGFIRTHLTLLELAEQSEVPDAATLLRKNLEAVARIRELETATDPEQLFRRPPNVSALKGNARLLYGGYSEVAHSSHPRVSQLLGGREDGGQGWVSLHPKFGEHTLVLVTNTFAVLGEFHVWSRDVFPKVSDSYPLEEADSIVSQLLALYNLTSADIDAMRKMNP